MALIPTTRGSHPSPAPTLPNRRRATSARRRRIHAALDERFRLPLEMESAAPPPWIVRTTMYERIREAGGGCYACWSTRATAAVMRSQLAVSSASCLRPAFVSWVELRATVVLGITPRRFDPGLLLEAVQRRVERALVHLQDVLRNLLETLGDAPAVHVRPRRACGGSADRGCPGEGRFWRAFIPLL